MNSLKFLLSQYVAARGFPHMPSLLYPLPLFLSYFVSKSKREMKRRSTPTRSETEGQLPASLSPCLRLIYDRRCFSRPASWGSCSENIVHRSSSPPRRRDECAQKAEVVLKNRRPFGGLFLSKRGCIADGVQSSGLVPR